MFTDVRRRLLPEMPRAEIISKSLNGRGAKLRKRARSRYDLAILWSPDDPEPPSNEKAINKFIKASGHKVQSQIQGDQLRVSSKSRDDLQGVIQALKEEDFGIPLQFTNYR